ncbi:MAG TPA: cytochrome c, partial [Bacteroidia bacterium]|nr:cytochrome c [Bacteroidia bacterium]
MKSIQKHLINLMIAGMGITLFAACGGSATKEEKAAESKDMNQYYEEEKQKEDAKVADDGKGFGKFTDVKVDPKLDKQMADAGKSIYDVKCSACHKLTDEKLVGPGWKGVTGKRTA